MLNERTCRIWTWILTASAGFTLALAPAFAQDRLNGYFLTSPLELGSGYDSQFLAGSRKLNDYETILAGPTLSWLRTTHRTEFSIDYQPEFEMFARYGSLDAWNHSSTMRLTHRLNARWSLVAGNSLLSTSDPTRALGNSLVLLPRGRYFQNSLYAGGGYKIDPFTKLTFRLDSAVNTMQLPAPLTGQLDHASNAVSITLDRSLTSTQAVSATYSFLHFTPFNPEISGGPTNVHVVNGVYTYNLGEDFVVRAAGGFVGGPQNAVTGGVTVEKTFSKLWTAVGYQRYVGFFGGLNPATGPQASDIPFAGGVSPNSVYQVVSFRAKGQVWRKFWLEASGQRATTSATDITRGIHSLIGNLRLDYRLTNRVSLFARADYYGQDVNRFVDSPLSERRYYIGIDVNVARYYRRPETSAKHRVPVQDAKPLPAVPPEDENQPVVENDK
jgi:hypothetical protein